jgi:hypothetical protein
MLIISCSVIDILSVFSDAKITKEKAPRLRRGASRFTVRMDVHYSGALNRTGHWTFLVFMKGIGSFIHMRKFASP